MINNRRIQFSLATVIFMSSLTFAQGIHEANQGFSMKIQLNNQGVLGLQAYSEGATRAANAGKLGLEYPLGQDFEHLFGSGVWVGGLLDTSRVGFTSPPIRGVTTAYEGWSGPFYEFFPGNASGDSIWRGGRSRPKPPTWDTYWGSSLPYAPIADDERYSTYTDFSTRVPGHVPLNLKVIQRSYAWDDSYADAIILFEYRLFNLGPKQIDSAYVGFFFEADVGPRLAANYAQRNFTGYFPNSRTAYIHNPSDRGSTPVGVTLLSTSARSLDSLRYSFRWYPGPQTPGDDNLRYGFLSSNRIDPGEFPSLSDTRFLFGFGPFTLKPFAATRESLTVAVAVVSGYDPQGNHVRIMQRNASRALDIYLNQGIRLPATPPSPPLKVDVGFRRVRLNWKWTPADTVDPRYKFDPERNWDSTNQVARRYPDRISNPPAGYDPNRGGRNFSSYKIWRSENPDSPDDSFTLLRQVDVPTDSFEYNTGLEYEYIDSNLVRGKTYVYAVTSKSIPNLAYQQIVVEGQVRTVEVPVDPLESRISTNKFRIDLPFSVSSRRGEVAVVPNPYRTDRDYTLESGGYEGLNSKWDETKRKVKFINLPERCTISIFSLAGDLVKTVEHGNSGGLARGDHDVELLSESNRALASGIYIFTVESPLGLQTGKFVIIR